MGRMSKKHYQSFFINIHLFLITFYHLKKQPERAKRVATTDIFVHDTLRWFNTQINLYFIAKGSQINLEINKA